MKAMTFSIRALIAVGLVGLVMMVIAACGSSAPVAPEPENNNPEDSLGESANGYLVEEQIVLQDGRTVICISDRYAGGVSCDWQGAR